MPYNILVSETNFASKFYSPEYIRPEDKPYILKKNMQIQVWKSSLKTRLALFAVTFQKAAGSARKGQKWYFS